MPLLLAFLAILAASPAHAISSFDFEVGEGKNHVTADRTLYHSKEKVYEAFGHVVISAKGRRISADYAWVDTVNHELKAKGNVIFVTPNSTVQATEIQFNTETNLGSIFYGKVSNDLYSLKGQLIRKVDADRYLTTEGEYTTCKDCAESWKFSARNVDLTMDGYAFMDTVYVRIKDIPTLYIPYLIVPVKTRRQTGLLFPRIGTSSRHGFSFVQPLFLAIDEHQDMTLGLGKYSSRGIRMEGEYRYKSYRGTEGILNYYRTNDRSYIATDRRTALYTENKWPFFDHFGMQWRWLEVSDRDYPTDFVEDVPGLQLPALESNVVASSPFSDFFLSAEVKRYRNLLYGDATGFDGGTVQGMPSVYFGLKERTLLGPLKFNVFGRYDSFRRHNGTLQDVNGNKLYDSGTDTLRQADRLIVSPELAAPFKAGEIFSLAPSVQYNENRYFFSLPTENDNLSSTSKRYLLTKLEASTVLERVYQYDGKKVNRFQHQIIPNVTYSYIPWIDEKATHPFTQQLKRDGGLFDQFDIIPVTNSTNFLRLPLGSAIYYGFTSRIVRHFRSPEETPRAYPYDILPKKEKVYPTPQNRKEELATERVMAWDQFGPRYGDYEEVWDFSVSQAYDFKEAANEAHKPDGDKKRAFSFLLAKSNLSIDDFSNTIEYKYFPRIVAPVTAQNPIPTIYKNQHSITTHTTWYLSNLKNIRGTRSFVRAFNFDFTNIGYPNPSRTIGGSVDWSMNDFFSLHYAQSWDLLTHERRLLSRTVKAIYNSPSECWQIGVRYGQNKTTGVEFGVDLGVNLLGTGYVGVNQAGRGGSSGGIFGGT